MTTDTIANTRGALRSETTRLLEEAITGRAETIEGGPLDGVRVVSMGNVREAVGEVVAAQLPPVDEASAEVTAGRSPARIVVWAVCPSCGIRQSLAVEITPTLDVSFNGRELKLHAKAKGRAHICGQLPVEDGTNQVTLDELEADTEDILAGDVPAQGEWREPSGDTTEDEAPVSSQIYTSATCPMPGYLLDEEHTMRAHDPLGTHGEDETDLRPPEPVNVDALIGEAERASVGDQPAKGRRGRNAANW